MRAPTTILATTILATAAAMLAGAAAAQTPADARADLLQRVTACRAMSDDQARLACFDAATAALDAAERKGELVVMDQTQIREAKRRAFGLELGDAFRVFERGEGGAQEVDEVTLTVAQASRGADDRWLVTTTDGQVWRQTEAGRGARAPQAGSSLEIRRGALGSFFMKIDGQRAVRARREK